MATAEQGPIPAVRTATIEPLASTLSSRSCCPTASDADAPFPDSRPRKERVRRIVYVTFDHARDQCFRIGRHRCKISIKETQSEKRRGGRDAGTGASASRPAPGY